MLLASMALCPAPAVEETSIFNTPVKSLLEADKFLVATPSTSVSDAANLMAGKNAGAVLVINGEHLVGIFTERDAVFRVMAQGRNPLTTPVSEVMTANPLCVTPKETYGHALLVMQEHGFRHVPVVDNGHAIGIISARNAMDPSLEDFVSEQRRREHYR